MKLEFRWMKLKFHTQETIDEKQDGKEKCGDK